MYWNDDKLRILRFVCSEMKNCCQYSDRKFIQKIIVGDCMIALDKFVKEGKKFDYVFGDLTDIPISETPTGEIWNFIRTILQQSFKILKSDGIYLTHVSRSLLM